MDPRIRIYAKISLIRNTALMGRLAVALVVGFFCILNVQLGKTICYFKSMTAGVYVTPDFNNICVNSVSCQLATYVNFELQILPEKK
jgi:hypothetical protein